VYKDTWFVRQRPLEFVLAKAIEEAEKKQKHCCTLALAGQLIRAGANVEIGTGDDFPNFLGMLLNLGQSQCRSHPHASFSCIVHLEKELVQHGAHPGMMDEKELAEMVSKVFKAYRSGVTRVLIDGGGNPATLSPYLEA
jgi:hypothetical protein